MLKGLGRLLFGVRPHFAKVLAGGIGGVFDPLKLTIGSLGLKTFCEKRLVSMHMMNAAVRSRFFFIISFDFENDKVR